MIKSLKVLSIAVLVLGAIHPMANGIADVQSEASVNVNAQEPRVYPNPWRSDRNANASVTFDRLPPNANVRVFTISGQEVKSLDATSGSVSWDRTNENGERVASGIYLYLVSDILGEEFRGKLALIN